MSWVMQMALAEQLASPHDAPTAASGAHVPHVKGDICPPGPTLAVPAHEPLWHCTPSVHAAPPASEPWKSHAGGGPSGSSQADESSAVAQASRVTGVMPPPGSANWFLQTLSKRARVRAASVAGTTGPPQRE